MDEVDAEANEILKQELEAWTEKTQEELRKVPYTYGFTSEYLYRFADFKEFSSAAKISTLLKLAKLDLQKRTTIGELIFACCKWFPKKAAIESLIELEKK